MGSPGGQGGGGAGGCGGISAGIVSIGQMFLATPDLNFVGGCPLPSGGMGGAPNGNNGAPGFSASVVNF
jgi:hypothetical protein